VSATSSDVWAYSRAPLQGLAEGVDNLGNLLLRLDDGRLVTLTAGDVTLAGSVT
jgi:biotin-(acetyl-CoA carboxylase) ligase